jgi:uncharacterized membrane protein (UPF0127 family)
MSLMLAAGCQEPDRAQHLPTVKMQIGSKTFTLEVADDDLEQQTGLMFRDSMPADHGMIFVFDDAEVRGFWMKNTRIPLDIIYVAPDGVIVAIKPLEPFDLRSTSSDRPAQYAIELNRGMAAASGIKVGDRRSIPPTKPAPATTQSR